MYERLFDLYSEVNTVLEEETNRCVAALRAEQSRLGITVSVKYKFLYKDGVVNRVKFVFPRYGVFIEKGARRGYGGRKGSKWRNSQGVIVSTNPASFGKMGTGKSPEKPWFNPVIENYTERLLERLKHSYVTFAFRKLKIK